MRKMRAKLKITSILKSGNTEQLNMIAVCKNEPYSQDGTDEDNTYALFTPQANASITINNPALLGQFKEGQKLYVDFTLADN
jgi:hypothetical protein